MFRKHFHALTGFYFGFFYYVLILYASKGVNFRLQLYAKEPRRSKTIVFRRRFRRVKLQRAVRAEYVVRRLRSLLSARLLGISARYLRSTLRLYGADATIGFVTVRNVRTMAVNLVRLI